MKSCTKPELYYLDLIHNSTYNHKIEVTELGSLTEKETAGAEVLVYRIKTVQWAQYSVSPFMWQ